MNQEKIGKYIAKCRKEKKLTQSELAAKIGCSDKSVSKWETGKCMPDLSLFNPLCEILGITVNDLMSGEKVDNKEYINTLEENIINMMATTERRNKKNKFVVCIVFLCFLLLLVGGYLFYNYYELDVSYDSNMMKCTIEDNNLVFESIGQSVLNYKHTVKAIDGKKIYLFHATINIYNKRRSNWEYSKSMSNLLEGKEPQFGHRHTLDINSNDEIDVYYSNISINKLNKMNNKEIKSILKDSYLMCKSE